MTPRALADWTVDTILEILSKGLFETEDFDFKESLPDPRYVAGKARLRGACCAFANANGGFLVFGVANDRGLSAHDRLKGIDPSLDFPERFGSFPQFCVPGVEWTFHNPPLTLASGRVLHVVHVPKSWRAPHAVGSTEDGWRFLKRTNKGDEGMNIDEVRASFLSYYEKRLRLQLLRAELSVLREHAKNARITDPDRVDKSYSLVTFDITVIESILADTYPLTATSPRLLDALAALRHEVSIANNKIAIFFSIVEQPLTGKDALVRRHNEFMAAKCEMIITLCTQAIDALEPILGPP
jgi:predicted HTH transcriptional regulator